MFALLLRLVVELANDARLAIWHDHVVARCRWLPTGA
jgi:hypothetical protein